jgi:hypothetical protein
VNQDESERLDLPELPELPELSEEQQVLEAARSSLLHYIGNDERLQTLASYGEAFVRRNSPGIVPGSAKFYQRVLDYVQRNEIKPPLPTFEAPPNFRCGMNEDE